MIKKCGCKNLPIIMTGILFVLFAIIKLFVMTPGGFAENMLVPLLEVESGFALFLAWLVIVFEFLGGIALLVRKKFSHGLFKFLVIGLIVIVGVAVIFAHLSAQDFLTTLKDLVIISVLISTLSSCCTNGHCKDGMCKVTDTSEQN